MLRIDGVLREGREEQVGHTGFAGAYDGYGPALVLTESPLLSLGPIGPVAIRSAFPITMPQ